MDLNCLFNFVNFKYCRFCINTAPAKKAAAKKEESDDDDEEEEEDEDEEEEEEEVKEEPIKKKAPAAKGTDNNPFGKAGKRKNNDSGDAPNNKFGKNGNGGRQSNSGQMTCYNCNGKSITNFPIKLHLI